MDESREEFLRFANLLPEAMLLVSMEGSIVAANQAVQTRLKRCPNDLAGCALTAIVADAADTVTQYLRACARSKAMVLGALRFLDSAGEEIPCRCEGAVYRPLAEGQPAIVLLRLFPRNSTASQFLALTQRIGELSTEIARRKQAEELLREQREWLQVTLSSIGDAVIATDVHIRVTFMNAVAQTLTGWSQEDALGKPLDVVFRIINEYSRQPVESPAERVMREGVVVGLANHTVLIARDGSESPIDDCAAPIRRDGQEITGTVLVFHGISERRKLERELSKQNATLIEADRRKNEFLAMLAHELRNPLAPLVTSLFVLQHDKSLTPAILQTSAIMERQIKHLVRLVDDLLDVARITRGRIELRKENIELNDVIDRAVETTAPLVAAQQHDLSVSTPRNRIWLNADPARLQQVLVNLLTNACKFTQPKGLIQLLVERQRDEVVISVRDNGVGMVAELLPNVFDLFIQADRTLARSEGGLGIGLTMVKKLIEMHDGRVLAESDGPGKGSKFSIWLPIVKADAPLLPALEPLQSAAGSTGLRILVVDDNIDAAMSLAMLLRTDGHDVVGIVHDGPAAVQAILSSKPSVVLLDIGLPGMNGYEVARQVRSQAQERTRLIALTGYGMESDKLRAQQAGIDHYVVKPVDPQRLREILKLGR